MVILIENFQQKNNTLVKLKMSYKVKADVP